MFLSLSGSCSCSRYEAPPPYTDVTTTPAVVEIGTAQNSKDRKLNALSHRRYHIHPKPHHKEPSARSSSSGNTRRKEDSHCRRDFKLNPHPHQEGEPARPPRHRARKLTPYPRSRPGPQISRKLNPFPRSRLDNRPRSHRAGLLEKREKNGRKGILTPMGGMGGAES